MGSASGRGSLFIVTSADVGVHPEGSPGGPRLLNGSRLAAASELAGVLGFAALLWVVDRPGVFAYDSMQQWYEGHIGRFDSNQPPALGFLWNQLAVLGESASVLIGLSCLSFVAGVYLVARYCFRPTTALVVLAAVALFPPVFSQIAIINKESVSCHLLLLGFGLVLQARRHGGNRLLCVLAAATTAVAVMIRYQYVVVAAVLYVAYLALQLARRPVGLGVLLRRAIVWTGVFALCVAGLATWIAASATVDWYGPFTQNLRFQRDYELSALVARATAPKLPEIAAAGVDPVGLISAMRRDYTPRSNVPIGEVDRLLAPVSNEVIARQTAALVRQQPYGLLRHRLAAFSWLLGLHEVCWPVQKQIIRPAVGTPERLWADSVGAGALQDSVASQMFRSRWFPVNNVLFRPIAYVVLAGGVLAWCVSTASRRARWGILAGLPFSGLVYAASFAMITPSCDFRYLYWTVLSTTLSLAIVLMPGAGQLVRKLAGDARGARPAVRS
jgi:hypothetical protein